VNAVRSDVKQLFDRLDMLVVLPKWILKLELLLVQNLRPVPCVRIAKDPPSHILRLDHEDAEPRNDDMIDLSGPADRRKYQVVE